MDAQVNLETLRKLAAIECGPAFGNAGDHLKAIAGRLAYVQQKDRATCGKYKGRSFYQEEVDALFCLAVGAPRDRGRAGREGPPSGIQYRAGH
jgi:hypothetical protein